MFKFSCRSKFTSLVENMAKKNRNHFLIAVFLTTLICSHITTTKFYFSFCDCKFKFLGVCDLLLERYFQDLFEQYITSPKNGLGQLGHTRSLKAYVHNCNVQNDVTPKTYEISKKCILLGVLQRWMVDSLFNFPKVFKDVVGIKNIAVRNDPNGPEKNYGGTSL